METVQGYRDAKKADRGGEVDGLVGEVCQECRVLRPTDEGNDAEEEESKEREAERVVGRSSLSTEETACSLTA